MDETANIISAISRKYIRVTDLGGIDAAYIKRQVVDNIFCGPSVYIFESLYVPNKMGTPDW